MLSLSTLPPGAQAGLIEQSLELSTSQTPLPSSLSILDTYLSAATFPPSTATILLTTLLHHDISTHTTYDSRARETLLRLTTALHLPPRILYLAEARLATLIRALHQNATTKSGDNIEAIPADLAESRRRKHLKWAKIGAAGLVSGLALGLSGGLIAPALLPALGSVGLAGVSAPLAALGGGGAVAVGGLFGAAGAGVGAAAMSGRTGAVNEFSFEPCTALGKADVRYDEVKVSPTRRMQEVVVPLKADEGVDILGGLLVWELLTSQDYPMIVPGGVVFGVQFRKFAPKGMEDGRKGDEKSVWLLPEEKMDAGGLDKSGKGRKRRTTGAITVQGDGLYILRFQIMPGSLPVKISYRVALVPPGKDPPVWIMEENEDQPVDQVSSDVRSLSLTIFVPGLVNTGEKGPYPGMFADQFASTAEALSEFEIQSFALRWDSSLLVELSDALRRLIGKMALSAVAQNGAMLAVPALVGAVALPVTIIAAIRTILGNIWAKVISHASECGYMLAAELATRSFGNRPVSLAGYSAGALVIFSCLQELARRKLVGIVHDVCLIGAPCTADATIWQEVRGVVSGRLINAYNPNDWYLELYHRGTNLGAVAGTRPVQDPFGKANVENICLTNEQVENHMDYSKRCSQILLDVGFGDGERRRPWLMLPEFEDEVEAAKELIRQRHISEDESEDLGSLSGSDDEVVLFEAVGRRRKELPRRNSLT